MALYWEAELLSQTLAPDLSSASYEVKFSEVDSETGQRASITRTVVVTPEEVSLPEDLVRILVTEAQNVIQFRKATRLIAGSYIGQKIRID